jgi:hypothetical protein
VLFISYRRHKPTSFFVSRWTDLPKLAHRQARESPYHQEFSKVTPTEWLPCLSGGPRASYRPHQPDVNAHTSGFFLQSELLHLKPQVRASHNWEPLLQDLESIGTRQPKLLRNRTASEPSRPQTGHGVTVLTDFCRTTKPDSSPSRVRQTLMDTFGCRRTFELLDLRRAYRETLCRAPWKY